MDAGGASDDWLEIVVTDDNRLESGASRYGSLDELASEPSNLDTSIGTT